MRTTIRTLTYSTILVVAAVAAASQPACAQTDRDAVERCRALPTDAERFACLEEYVLGDDDLGDDDAAQASVDASRETSVDAIETPAVENAPAERRRLLRLPSIPFTGGGAERNDAPVVRSATGSPEAVSLGEEQVAERNGDDTPRAEETRYAARVVNVEESFFGGLQVELESGQVWRQLRDDGMRIAILDSNPIEDVELWRSNYGGYRMRLVDQRRTIRVERIE